MDNSNSFDDVSILIVGFDGYIDVWDHFFSLINKYWFERPKTYLATSVLTPEYDNVTVIPAGSGSEWSKRTFNALKKINTPYIILMLEDFFVTDYVDNKLLKESIDLIKKHDIKFYQLLIQAIGKQRKSYRRFINYDFVRVIPTDKRYALNLQAAIWNKDFLMKCIGEGNYNAWFFEINHLNPEDINTNNINCLIDNRNILNIEHTIVQSKYLPKSIKKLKKLGININPDERGTLEFIDNFKYNLKLYMYSHTPKWMFKPFKILGKFLGVDFVTDRIKSKTNKSTS